MANAGFESKSSSVKLGGVVGSLVRGVVVVLTVVVVLGAAVVVVVVVVAAVAVVKIGGWLVESGGS